eukprot:scaffold15046_cov72-Phaeocystis_antarctica.AAC.2
MPVQLVTIEGNIGTGKSTLANHVAQYMPTMRFFASPEHEENPHWAAFAANPAKHALTMQCWLLRARLHVYLRALRHMEEARESVILDFSIWSDLIFATKHHEDGNLTAAEFERYQQLAREIYALELPPPHLSIVLQATPEICLQRHSRLNMPLPRSSPCGHPPLQQPTRLPRAARSALVGPRHLSCRREVTAGALVRPQRCQSNDKRTRKPELAHLHRLDALYEQRWLRELPKAYTLRWVDGQRSERAAVGIEQGGLPAAPSLLTLVRDWSDLSLTKPSAIADAVMCTPPTLLEEWLAAFKAAATAERIGAVLEEP